MKPLACLFLAMAGFLTSAFAQEKPRASLQWGGDLRLRTQIENDDNKDSRLTERLRLRVGVTARLQEDLTAQIRLATATGNRSANQALGDKDAPGSPRRFIGLDLAFADWKPLSFLEVFAGRLPQFQYKPAGSEILLDDDVAFEGVGVQLRHQWTAAWSGFANLGSMILRENYDSYYSEEQTDNVLNFGQLGVVFEGEEIGVTVGGGFYNYVGLQGMTFSDIAAGASARGNSENGVGVIKNNFVPRQVFFEVRRPWGSWETEFGVEHLVNSETTDPNQAWWVSATLGQKSWDTTLAWGQTDSDAVPSMFTQSSFGNGQTDIRGVLASGRWKFARGVSLRLTQMVCRLQATTNNTPYSRTHLDFSMSF